MTVVVEGHTQAADRATAQGRAALRAVLDSLPVRDLYEDEGAQIYASQTSADRSELPHVRRLARRLRAMPAGLGAVDLAAGDGRLTGALLGAGRDVHAVDTSPVLLDLLGARFAEQPQVRAVEADMTTWTPDAPAGLVVIGAGSIRLLDAEQRAALFRTVRGYLHEEGILSLGTMDTAPVAHPTLMPWGTHRTSRGECPVTFFSHRDGGGNWDVTGFLVTGPGPLDEARLYSSRVRRVGSATLVRELAGAGFEQIVASSVPAPVGGDPEAAFTTLTAAAGAVDLADLGDPAASDTRHP